MLHKFDTLKFKVFHIFCAKNYLSGCGSRLPTGSAGADKAGGNECTIPRSGADKAGGNECTIPRSQQKDGEGAKDCKAALSFAFGAKCPAFDADQYLDSIGDADNYIGKAAGEVASVLSLAAGRSISIAMTVEKLQREIQCDDEYKYVRKIVAEKLHLVFAGELAKYNYHCSNLSVSLSGLILYKGTRCLVPKIGGLGYRKPCM